MYAAKASCVCSVPVDCYLDCAQPAVLHCGPGQSNHLESRFTHEYFMGFEQVRLLYDTQWHYIGSCNVNKFFCRQGLQSLEMINVVGAYPTETEELLGALRGLTKLSVRNNTAAVKMAPMHCLARMPALQVCLRLICVCEHWSPGSWRRTWARKCLLLSGSSSKASCSPSSGSMWRKDIQARRLQAVGGMGAVRFFSEQVKSTDHTDLHFALGVQGGCAVSCCCRRGYLPAMQMSMLAQAMNSNGA